VGIGGFLQIESIPTWFSDTWNITLASAQAILSITVIVSVLIPILYLNRGRKGVVVEMLVFFLTEALLVGLGWLPFWLLIGTVAMMALAIAFIGSSAITGG